MVITGKEKPSNLEIIKWIPQKCKKDALQIWKKTELKS